ncbi:quinone oxidoreductase family protein [Amycolatopsis antarctica]|nr:zinc-binding dehydrogenase [Amycolatopsis antarctica]
MGDTMRAVVVGPGGWRHEAVPVPVPGPGEVLVRVTAAGLNRADADELDGTYAPRARRAGAAIAGSDLSGTVERAGPGVPAVAEGEHVCAMVDGAFAEFVAVDHRLLLPVPAGMPMTAAAAWPSALLTEHDALFTQGGLRPGRSVLVTGATSGVGRYGAELARWAGASPVLGTTTRPGNAAALAATGAQPVVTSVDDLAGVVLDATGGRGADIVVDHVGGELLDELVGVTAVGGTLVQVGRLGGRYSTLDVDRLARRRIRLLGTSFRTRDDAARARVVTAARETLSPPGRDIPVPRTAAVFAFDEAERALASLRAGEGMGKIVLAMDGRAAGGCG